jgi:GxxExxY protein
VRRAVRWRGGVKACENALAHELRNNGIAAEQQRGTTVVHDGISVGEYFVDLLVEHAIMVELKTVQQLNAAH